MNIIKFEPDLNEHEKLDIPVLISRFLEKVANDNKLDIQDIMMWYDKRNGVLEIIEHKQPQTILGIIELNDL